MSETPFFFYFYFYFRLKVDPADFHGHQQSKELFTRIISDISSAISQLVPRGARRRPFFSPPWLNEPECATAAVTPRNSIIHETVEILCENFLSSIQ